MAAIWRYTMWKNFEVFLSFNFRYMFINHDKRIMSVTQYMCRHWHLAHWDIKSCGKWYTHVTIRLVSHTPACALQVTFVILHGSTLEVIVMFVIVNSGKINHRNIGPMSLKLNIILMQGQIHVLCLMYWPYICAGIYGKHL